MQVEYISVPYLITPVKNHSVIKQKLLEFIEQEPFSSHGNISRTDWHIPSGYIRQYMNYLYPMIYEEIENIHKVLLVPKFELQNFWFQQYESNDYHSWHNHFQSTYASVYYVELPDASVATEFKNPVTGEIIKPSVKEGDILTFPASIIHRSPPNNSGGRKTIIAINTIANVD